MRRADQRNDSTARLFHLPHLMALFSSARGDEERRHEEMSTKGRLTASQLEIISGQPFLFLSYTINLMTAPSVKVEQLLTLETRSSFL